MVTVAEQARQMQVQVPAIPAENYLIEPHPRGTASVVALAAAVLKKRDPQADDGDPDLRSFHSEQVIYFVI